MDLRRFPFGCGARLHRAVLTAALVAAVLAAGPALADNVYVGQPAKYVFLFIGDGMGLPQRHSAEVFLASVKDPDKPGATRLNMSYLPAQGMCTTYSTNSIITDSAAAATALACGCKTKSGVIAMDVAGKESYPTIAEMAREKGLKVGVISSVSIDHATPACFYAHEPSRKNYYKIGRQLAGSGFEFFGGGGFNSPEDKKHEQPNLYEVARQNGFKTVFLKEQFLALKPGGGKVLAVNAKLDEDAALDFEMDRDKEDISLAEFTAKAIELLDNPKGFFIMVEGGKIDWACHANDAGASIRDTIAFDEALGEALKFYEKRPSETLIVVTGDHECGGMTIGFAGTQYATFFDKVKHQTRSYISFGQVLDDYKAAHKETPRFEEVLPLIEASFGLLALDKSAEAELKKAAEAGDKAARDKLGRTLSEREMALLETAFAQSMLGQKVRSKDEYTYLLYGGYDPLTIQCTHILNNKAGIAWTSYSHTGVPVPTSAIGLGHGLFNGYYDNTDVAKKMMSILGLQVPALARAN